MFWGAGVKGAARETILCLGGCAGKVTCGVHMAAYLSLTWYRLSERE